MDVYVLRNFLAIAEHGNMTHAAEALHISQPALSMQVKRLEGELGKQLFVRHSRHLALTDEGQLLKQRAETIVGLMDKTVAEFRSLDELGGGEIRAGCAESHLIGHFARAFSSFREDCPRVRIDITSGGTDQVLGLLARDEIDLAIIVEPPHLDRYHFIEVPGSDEWGAVVRDDDPLAELDEVTVDELVGRELHISRQSLTEDLPRWAGPRLGELRFLGHYNLAYNGAVFVREGLGVLLTFRHLIDCHPGSGLYFRPLTPPLRNKMFIVWQKNQVFTPIVQRFVEHLTVVLGRAGQTGATAEHGDTAGGGAASEKASRKGRKTGPLGHEGAGK